MTGVYVIMVLVGLGALVTMLLMYKFYWSPKKHWDELYSMLRRKGIGDRPETIVKDYYKLQHRNLSEKETRELTRQYLFNNKEFFLTMYDNIKGKKPNKGDI